MPFRITGSFCQERVTRVYNKLIDFFVPLLMFVLVLVCVRVLPFRLRLFLLLRRRRLHFVFLQLHSLAVVSQ